MAAFKYEPLDSDSPIFRLLRLHKGSGLVIECEIFQASFTSDDLIPYEALSYTWGGSELSASVQLAQHTFAVTENLYLAMQYIRSEEEDRILWVDAICIDQGNPKERGHQVGQMGTIYARADRVVIWLGPPTDDTDILMDSLKRLEEESTQFPCSRWTLRDKRWTELWSSLQLSLMSQHWGLAVRQVTGLKTLLARPWFKRVWILQEVANAKRACVTCGTKSISARSFALAPVLLDTIPEPHCQPVLDIMPGPSRKESWWNRRRDLYTLLQKFRNSKAGDQRDMIFALLGISSDAQDTDYLRADYEKSVDQVVHAAVSFIFGLSDYPSSGHAMSKFLLDFRSLNGASLARLAKLSNADHVAKFIEERKHEISFTSAAVEAAAGNKEYGGEIMSVLSAQPEFSSKITRNAVVAAVGNAGSGAQVMRYFLERRTAELDVVETAVTAAAEDIEGSAEVINFLLERRQDATMEAAASCGERVMDFILQKEGVKIALSEMTILKAVSNTESGTSVIRLLLEHHASPIRITNRVVMRIAKNKECGNDIMNLLLEKQIDSFEIGHGLIDTIVSFFKPAVLDLIIERRGVDVQISADMVASAAINPSAIEVMEYLIRRAKGSELTPKLIVPLARRFYPGQMELLLAQRGCNIDITEELFKEACRKSRHSATIAVLLKHWGNGTLITEEIVKAAASNETCGGRMVQLLYDQPHTEVKITEDIMKVAAANKTLGLEVMEVLLYHPGEKLEITNATLITAAENQRCARPLLELLLQFSARDVVFTDEMVQAVLSNILGGFDIAGFLLRKHAERFVVTEWLTVELARAYKPTLMALLLEHRGNDVQVTEELMGAAARNSWCGKEITEMLLRQRRDEGSDLKRKR
jgi:hypothetical protein